MDALARELTIEQIPDSLCKDIAEAIGVENLIKLADIVGGSTFYMPKTDSLIRPVRDAKIKEEFNGYNHFELAKKYDVTERWVRILCGAGHPEGQLSLLDYEKMQDDADNDS